MKKILSPATFQHGNVASMPITDLINDGIRKIISLSHEQTLPILKDDSSAEETI